jgi:hypothetical protein
MDEDGIEEGSFVICINADYAEGVLKVGDIYEVKSTSSRYLSIYLNEMQETNVFLRGRFKLHNPSTDKVTRKRYKNCKITVVSR